LIILYPFSIWYVCKLDSWARILVAFGLALKLGVTGHLKAEAPVEYKKAIEADGKLKKVYLDPRVPERDVCIGVEAGQ
jgi:hypothetical protein